MATGIAARSSVAPISFPERQNVSSKRTKKEARTDIWTSLLKQTHEAQARRSRTSAMQNRSLLVCGGASAEDQRAFLQRLARPPPPSQPRNQERGKQQQQRAKGEVRLSNTYAYGYGHVTLFSPPGGQTGGGGLGTEAEEAARVLVHTIPGPDKEFVPLVRRLLAKSQRRAGEEGLEPSEDFAQEPQPTEDETDVEPRPSVCILLSWKHPWKFMAQIRNWIQLLAEALLPPNTPPTDPMDILKEAKLALAIVVQHTEAQEELFREGYKEEDFDYISQCLRTVMLPLHPHSALVYMSGAAPPQQPGSSLSEVQKVLYTTLDLNIAALSPKPLRSATGDGIAAKKEELHPKHEFMDRMQIVIPAGWDSAAFIRTLSETFSPEDVLNAWLLDLQPPARSTPLVIEHVAANNDKVMTLAANEEVYASSSPLQDSFSETPPVSPSKQTPSAINQYEFKILNPQAHKVLPSGPPPIEVTTKPTQSFLAEMRSHLQDLEAQDRERNADSQTSTTRFSGRGAIGMPAGEQSGALDDLGDVSFNVGGVSYDAGRAVERLKRPPLNLSSSMSSDTGPLSPGSRVTTPRPRPAHSYSKAEGTPSAAPTPGLVSGVKDLPVDKLEEYFASLMKKGAGGASRDGTPTRPKGGE